MKIRRTFNTGSQRSIRSVFQWNEVKLQSDLSPPHQGEKPEIDSEIPSSLDVALSKPFGVQDPRDLQDVLHDKYESFGSAGSLSTIDDVCHWLAHHMPSAYDSSDSTGTVTSDGDAITTSIDVTWHKLPPTRDPPSSPLRDCCSCACSQDVRRAMAQQGVLLSVFHEELRRIIPNDQDYNSTWLEEVDSALVLAPLQGDEDICRR